MVESVLFLVNQSRLSRKIIFPKIHAKRKVAEVRSTAPKDAVKRVLDEKKWGKEKLCQELEELRAARKRYLRPEVSLRIPAYS